MIANTRPHLKKAVGWVAYVDGAARSLAAATPFRIVFQIDGHRLHSAKVHSILVANCGALPAGIALMPDASVSDGMLDAAIIQPTGWFGWIGVWRKIWWDNSVLRRFRAGRRVLERRGRDRSVHFRRGATVEIATSPAQPVELDGDEFGDAVALTPRVCRRARSRSSCPPATAPSTERMAGTSIVWFRDDLRLADNAALAAAVDSGTRVVCLYLLDEHSPGIRPLGAAARWWLHGSLAALGRELAAAGTQLVLRRGAATEVIPRSWPRRAPTPCSETGATDPSARRMQAEGPTARRGHRGDILPGRPPARSRRGENGFGRVVRRFHALLARAPGLRTAAPAPPPHGHSGRGGGSRLR